jgi:hypothetical protein
VGFGEIRRVQRVCEIDFAISLGKNGYCANSRAGYSQEAGGAGCVMWELIPILICRSVLDPTCTGEPVHSRERLAQVICRNVLDPSCIGEPVHDPERLVGEH